MTEDTRCCCRCCRRRRCCCCCCRWSLSTCRVAVSAPVVACFDLTVASNSSVVGRESPFWVAVFITLDVHGGRCETATPASISASKVDTLNVPPAPLRQLNQLQQLCLGASTWRCHRPIVHYTVRMTTPYYGNYTRSQWCIKITIKLELVPLLFRLFLLIVIKILTISRWTSLILRY